MKKVVIIGHFAKKQNFLDGQTIKTIIFTEELERFFGKDNVERINTFCWKKNPFKLFLKSILAVLNCKNVLFFTDQGGIKVFPWLLTISNIFGKCKIHYVVIGGWLPEFMKKHGILRFFTKKLDYIYVETSTMKKSLDEQGFGNVYIVPNCKELDILERQELVYNECEPFRLCTFSRVMREKGIEDAAKAVTKINEKYGKIIYTLDIYGQVDPEQTEWFEELKKNFPEYIQYKGCAPFDKSVEILKNYFALLFPTYYESEGFAGTLLDAFASGLPVIASNWKYNSEIVKEGTTGTLYNLEEDDGLFEKLNYLYKNTDVREKMRINCLQEAEKYTPKNVISRIISKIN